MLTHIGARTMHRDHSSNPNAPINRYTFGTLTLSFKGLGLPFLSDKSKALIEAMDLTQAKAANQAAWKAMRDTTAICNRSTNASIPGNQPAYDRAYQHYQVAEQVKRLTWQRIKALQG